MEIAVSFISYFFNIITNSNLTLHYNLVAQVNDISLLKKIYTEFAYLKQRKKYINNIVRNRF